MMINFEDKHPFDFYSNGCHITPIQVLATIGGENKTVWMWAVSNDDDTVFYDGQPIDINLYSETIEGLVKEPEPEPEIEEEEYVHNDDDWDR